MPLLRKTGTITLLRVHRLKSGFGPADDFIDGELVVRLSSAPTEAYGITLRADADGPTHRAMFDLLRDAFNDGRPVILEVEVDTGKLHGSILRVTVEPVEPASPELPVITDPFGGIVVGPATPE